MTPRERNIVKVCHIINNLDVGGAEMMLLKLLTAIDRREYDSTVISLIGRGLVGQRIADLGVPVQSLGFRQSLPRPWDLWRLRREIARFQPDVVQTWMFHSDLLGGLAASTVRPRPAIVWNIRHSNLAAHVDKRTTYWTVSLCAKLSHQIPHRIIVNSEAGRQHHAELGYNAGRLIVVPNGFDLQDFSPSAAARVSLRKELELPPDARLVGHVGRFNPQKDHVGFIRAAGQMANSRQDVWFVMCGREVTLDNPELAAAIERTGRADRFRLLGRRDDMSRVHAAMDVTVSSSGAGEGFPNVVGEAMASGVPCVVTDIGGSAEVVGEAGRVVPPFNHEALAAAVIELLNLPTHEFESLQRRARQRVERQFDIRKIAADYCNIWGSAAPQPVSAPLRRAA